jgi:hypothetical protein
VGRRKGHTEMTALALVMLLVAGLMATSSKHNGCGLLTASGMLAIGVVVAAIVVLAMGR